MEENKVIMEMYRRTAEIKVGLVLSRACHWRPLTLLAASGGSLLEQFPQETARIAAAFLHPFQTCRPVRSSSSSPPALPQCEPVEEYVQLLLEGGQKFLCFAHHTSLLDAVEHSCNKKKVK